MRNEKYDYDKINYIKCNVIICEQKFSYETCFLDSIFGMLDSGIKDRRGGDSVAASVLDSEDIARGQALQ